MLLCKLLFQYMLLCKSFTLFQFSSHYLLNKAGLSESETIIKCGKYDSSDTLDMQDGQYQSPSGMVEILGL